MGVCSNRLFFLSLHAMNLEDLPKEIISHIISSLPFESVKDFRLVSKNVNEIILSKHCRFVFLVSLSNDRLAVALFTSETFAREFSQLPKRLDELHIKPERYFEVSSIPQLEHFKNIPRSVTVLRVQKLTHFTNICMQFLPPLLSLSLADVAVTTEGIYLFATLIPGFAYLPTTLLRLELIEFKLRSEDTKFFPTRLQKLCFIECTTNENMMPTLSHLTDLKFFQLHHSFIHVPLVVPSTLCTLEIQRHNKIADDDIPSFSRSVNSCYITE